MIQPFHFILASYTALKICATVRIFSRAAYVCVLCVRRPAKRQWADNGASWATSILAGIHGGIHEDDEFPEASLARRKRSRLGFSSGSQARARAHSSETPWR
jgi:hypothetical protein